MPATRPIEDADDLVHPERWERSRERSHRRRLLALRRRRWQRGTRSLAVVLAAALTLGGGGAFAAPAGDAGAAVLKEGGRGPVVARLQQKLGITADGVFGPRTERSVRRYQRAHGLVVDGIVGPRTARALGIGLARAQAWSVRSSGRVRVPSVLEAIARCESGGNPRAVSPDGRYRGKYQFDRQTWAAYGPAGDPARASEAEQDRRALALYRARGTAPWPSCA